MGPNSFDVAILEVRRGVQTGMINKPDKIEVEAKHVTPTCVELVCESGSLFIAVTDQTQGSLNLSGVRITQPGYSVRFDLIV